jgi:hypothetical protein
MSQGYDCDFKIRWSRGTDTEFLKYQTEIQEHPSPPGYSAYLRRKTLELTAAVENRQVEPAIHSEPLQDSPFSTNSNLLARKSNQQNTNPKRRDDDD